jgi:hypothetical protein
MPCLPTEAYAHGGLFPMPYSQCPIPYSHEYLIFLRQAIDAVQLISPPLATVQNPLPAREG